MPKGYPNDGLWRGKQLRKEWLDRQEQRPCMCGCGGLITPKVEHRHRGRLPQFLRGHHARVRHWNYKLLDEWVKAEQGSHACQCGCAGIIEVVKRHHATGIPRYLKNHGPRPKLGHGPEHPKYIVDRRLVKTRGGRGFTPYVIKQIWKRCGGRCVRCDSTLELECDHIVPVFLGGSGEPENGQLLCRDCHVLKSRLERVLSRPGDGLRRFMSALIAFLPHLEKEIAIHGDCRRSAHVP